MKITVEKASLSATLRANREAHAAQFQKAIVKYREKAIAKFTENIAIIQGGGDVEQYLHLPVPEEHTDDYDRAIEMMEWDTGTEMQLDETQFEQYVRNRWGWAKTFFSNTTSYMAS